MKRVEHKRCMTRFTTLTIKIVPSLHIGFADRLTLLLQCYSLQAASFLAIGTASIELNADGYE